MKHLCLIFLFFVTPALAEEVPLSFKFTERVYDHSEAQANPFMHIALMSHISLSLEDEDFIHASDEDTDLLIDFHLFNRAVNSQENDHQQQSQLDFIIVVYWNNEEMLWREPLYYEDSLGVQFDSAEEKMNFSRLTAQVLSTILKKERLYLGAL